MRVRYLVAKPRKDGTVRHYWQPKRVLAEAGFLTRRLSDDLPKAIAEAEKLNHELDLWYRGQGPVPIDPASLAGLIRLWQTDASFKGLRDRTQNDHLYYFRHIEAWAGDAPVSAITRRAVKAWYRALVEGHGPSFASHAIATLRRLLSFAVDEEWIERNPADRMRIKAPESRAVVWTDAQVAAFCDTARAMGRPSMALAALLAWALGQRIGDVLRLTWAAWDGQRITLRQSKTGQPVSIRPLPELRAALDAARQDGQRTAPQMVVSEITGRPYQPSAFQHTAAKIRTEAGLPKELQMADLRRTAATNLGRAGCTDDEIRAVTGHKTRAVVAVYVRPDNRYADNALAKLARARQKNKTAS